MRHLRAVSTTHTSEEIGTRENELNNVAFASTLVQLLPVLGISLVIEARWLISSSWWKSHNKNWQSFRLFMMLFALACIFMTEIFTLRLLEGEKSFSNLTTLTHVTLTLTFVCLLWLPIEEITSSADLDGKAT